MGLGLHNTNRHDTIIGPAITIPPLQAKLADPRPNCRRAVLDATDFIAEPVQPSSVDGLSLEAATGCLDFRDYDASRDADAASAAVSAAASIATSKT